MSERAWLLHVRQSVFTKLVAIMLAMAAILLVLAWAFFLLYLGPVMNASIDGVVHEYVHTVAATAPSYERAKAIGDRLDVQTRYEGPDGAWATADNLPTIAEARRHERGSFSGRHYYVTSAPNGGTHLFAWKLTDRMHTAHLVVPGVMLLLIATVVFAAHGVLKRLLLPLRWLGDGVARLCEGHLDVVVPTRSADEFGALTDAFNRMVGRIKDMILARDQLLLDVSHELRSPVTRLKVALELVADPDMKARMAADVAEMEIMIGERLELERLRDGHEISTARQNVFAGALQDVSRYVQTLPGVVIGSDDFRNDIIVRGGSPLENLFIVDNVEVPNINTFANFASAGGTVSILDPSMIRDVTFITGGYPASYTNRTSSILQNHPARRQPRRPPRPRDAWLCGSRRGGRGTARQRPRVVGRLDAQKLSGPIHERHRGGRRCRCCTP